MIITKIQGGLGNQMFQYAYGKHLSIVNNTNLYIDKEFYNGDQGKTVRKYSLGSFGIDYPDYNLLDNGKPTQRINDIFTHRELPQLDNNNYYLDGYWQSEKYFKSSESVIRNDFKMPISSLKSKNDIFPLDDLPLLDKNTVSMHVRRTDYVESNGYYEQLDRNYYERAMGIIGDYDYIFVFSDDIRWCRENLPFENMVFITGNSDIVDMKIMSMCKNNIIANSSFSWWGAWLNENPDKKIVAPIKWFGDRSGLNGSDIIPETWEKI